MTQSNIGIRSISGALGAEIGGIDLAERMSEQTFWQFEQRSTTTW